MVVKQESILQMIEAYKRFWRLEKKYSDLLGDDNEIYREIFELWSELQQALGIDDALSDLIMECAYDSVYSREPMSSEELAKLIKERLV